MGTLVRIKNMFFRVNLRARSGTEVISFHRMLQRSVKSTSSLKCDLIMNANVLRRQHVCCFMAK